MLLLLLTSLALILSSAVCDSPWHIRSLIERQIDKKSTELKPAEPIAAGWQPPELPDGCKTAVFSFADLDWTINLDDIKNGKPFSPDMGLPNTERAKALIDSLPTVFLKNNRLCIRWMGFTTGTNLISNPFVFDEKLPAEFDRNYSDNSFEVVDKNQTPVLQVIYERPNHVRVNGIFRGSIKGELAPVIIEGKPHGMIWAVFGKYHKIYLPSNAGEDRLILDSFRTNVLFKYPSFNHRGEYDGHFKSTDPTRVGEYELFAPDVVSNIIKTLNDPAGRAGPAVTLVYPVNPDESAYALSEQIKSIFRSGGYFDFSGPPPRSIPEVPGVSCFLYRNAAFNTGIWEACRIILMKTGSHGVITIMPGDADPWFTNPVVVVMIRKK